jgi:hypothetical protein
MIPAFAGAGLGSMSVAASPVARRALANRRITGPREGELGPQVGERLVRRWGRASDRAWDSKYRAQAWSAAGHDSDPDARTWAEVGRRSGADQRVA